MTRETDPSGAPRGAADDGELTSLLLALARRLDDVEGPQGWIPALRFGLAGALSEAGENDVAARATALLPIRRLRRVVHPCGGVVRHQPAGAAQQPARALEAVVRDIAAAQAPGCLPTG